MNGPPETLVAQNNYSYDDLVALCRDSRHPTWSELDCQYWAIGKKQYHGPYTDEGWQAMSGSMQTGNSLAQITAPVLILKADASPEVRAANEEAVKAVVQNGKIVHIDGAGHNLHQDEPERSETALREFLSTL